MPPDHSPPHRPPWWPESEAWPPQRPPWRQWRGRFFWRIGGLLLLLFILTVGGCTLAFWLTAAGLGWIIEPRPPRGFEPGLFPFAFWRVGGGLGLALVIVGVFLIARVFRRVAAPVGDLMEAAGRVEAGDYTARVAEAGPREMRALARAFNAMTERLQRDEAQRRNLLADVTHELRTPLAVIQGNLEGLVDGVYPADKGHLAPILDETRVLARLIDDLRTLALAESGALKLHREPTDVGVLVNEAAAAFRAQAAGAGVQLNTEIDEAVPIAEMDPLRMREVLSNLLANALRYTPSGGAITVSASAEAGQLRLTVQDSGAGIAPEQLPHIFDRFYKSDESRGMGLGLAIARNLVVAHGGEITAESAPGRGTAMRLRLPLAEPEP
jgi:signal transduction histidine kinase